MAVGTMKTTLGKQTSVNQLNFISNSKEYIGLGSMERSPNSE